MSRASLIAKLAQERCCRTFRRQYEQFVELHQLKLPAPHLLRNDGVQSELYDILFDRNRPQCRVSERYRYRVLKMIMLALEECFIDPEDDAINDDLSHALAQYMQFSMSSESEAAQVPVVVTYTVPNFGLPQRQVFLQEKKSLLAAAGTTGFRTWEAALHLARYLFTDAGHSLVVEKSVVELGAGTGLLSIACAKFLGASAVLATDGSAAVVDAMEANFLLNGKKDMPVPLGLKKAVFQWGQKAEASLTGVDGHIDSVDLILGADITYDLGTLPALVCTISEMLKLHPRAQTLIAATIRHEDTVNEFLELCRKF